MNDWYKIRQRQQRGSLEKDEENRAVGAVAPIPVVAPAGPNVAGGDEDANNFTVSNDQSTSNGECMH